MTASAIIADWIVSALDSAVSGTPVIRQSDETFDRAESVVVVDCEDQGDHLGIPGHVLVDLRAAVGIWVHTTDDPALAQTDALRTQVRSALEALPQGDVQPVGGWYVRYISGWTESPATLDGNDRKIELTATMILQSTSI
jgi:hypothetical protein